MYKYEVILYWSNADGVFVAEAPELPGCMAHGDTQEAALKPESTEGRPWGQPLKKAEGAPLNLG